MGSGGDDGGGFWEPLGDLFRATAEQGEEWGSFWPYLLPAALALFFVMVIFSGLRFTAEKIEQGFKAWWVFAVFLIIVLLVVAFNRDSLSADDADVGRADVAVPVVSTA